jgi:2-amino-1-hydroxyethylphosphonate dioxygenase (glycine-forming)
MTPCDEIAELFEAHGNDAYFGENVTQLAHALQSASWAERAGADEETIVAALLHDIGHLLEGDRHDEIGVIDHDSVAERWLTERKFPARLIRLVRGHVDAKRYQVAVNPEYCDRLSEASKQTLALQGGPMNPDEAAAFAQDPLFREMIRLRQWDELAKDPEAQAPAWLRYAPMIERVWRSSQ